VTDDDTPTLADAADALDEVARILWPLVDVVSGAVYAEDDGPRRLELRAVQEHTAQAWAQAQHALVVLRALVAVDGRPCGTLGCPGCPDCQGIPVGDL